MRISILHESATGKTLYSETHTATTDANGKVNLEVGTGNVVSGNFAGIVWENGPYFIKTETDPTGGNNYTIFSNNELVDVEKYMKASSEDEGLSGASKNFSLFSSSDVSGISTADTTDNLSDKMPGDSDAVDYSGFKHYLGEIFGGGVIFNLWKDKAGEEHGHVVTVSFQSSGFQWSNVNSLVGAGAKGPDGLRNCNAIYAQAGHRTSAAKLCLDFVSGGQNDWYLPSSDELGYLYDNRFKVNRSLAKIDGATALIFAATYWSSTEESSSYAWYLTMSDGTSNYGIKTEKYYVRAIRAF